MGVFQNNLMGAAAAAASAGGGDFYTHQIANSIRNSAAQNGTLQFTAGTPTSSTTFTMSYWVKRYTNTTDGDDTNIFVTGTGGGAYAFMAFGGNTWQFQPYGGSWGTGGGITMNPTALYRDTSAWYHHVIIWDTTQSTQADRVRMYVNGERITSFSTEGVTGNLAEDESLSFINQSGVVQAFGGLSGKGHGTEGADLQMAEIVFNDGQSYAPSNYGETKNGVWIPKDPSGLTFGNNGYWLKMASGAIGTDSSGNGNNFTVSNIAAHDVMLDSPTFSATDGNGGNFATMNPLSQGSYATLSEGNLKVTGNTGADVGRAIGNMAPTTGKWYFEINMEDVYAYIPSTGLRDVNAGNMGSQTTGPMLSIGMEASGALISYSGSGQQDNMGTVTSTSTGVSSFSDGDIMMIAWDCENRKMWIGKNGTFFNSGNPASGSNPQFSWTAGSGISAFTPQCGVSTSGSDAIFNFGQDGTFAGTKTAQGNSDDTGYGNFYYSPPTGYLALCSGNLPIADAVDPAQTDDNFPQKLFDAKLYTGDGGSSTAITGVGFQPDWVWIKRRNAAENNNLYDSSRGVNKRIQSNRNVAETTEGLPAFGSDGFTVDASGGINNVSSQTYVAWNWRANGGTTSSGSGDLTSTHQVDPSGGFSIVLATGDGGSGDKTVSHGLSAAPTVILAKKRSGASNWDTYFSEGVTAGSGMRFNTDEAPLTGRWGTINSSIMTCKDNYTWYSTDTFVYYCFTNIEGYIKSGTYVGNANDNGVFVYTGFKPAFFMCKPIVTGNWRIQDTKRTPFNIANKTLFPNRDDGTLSNDSNDIDIVSNGVKMRASDSDYNQATTFVYLAMAENPFKFAVAR